MNTFTRDLIDWIEKNLEGKLTIDDVSAKAGYSKWHLQRMFRDDTGFQLAWLTDTCATDWGACAGVEP